MSRIFKNQAWYLLVFLSLVACGSKMPREIESGSAVLAPPPASADGTAATVAGCNGEQVTLSGKQKTYDGKANRLLAAGGKPISFCDVLIASGKEAIVLQFAGVLCITCQEEAVYLSAAISRNSSRSSKIGHVIVFTDFYDDFSEEDYQNFMATYAVGSLRNHDDSIKYWKTFTTDPKNPTRPTFFAMNNGQEAQIFNDSSGGNYKDIVGIAESLLAKKPTDDNVIIVDGSVKKK